MTATKKKFDCVEMQHRGAEAIRRATQGMTREEELAYWQRGTAELLEMQRKLREASALPAATTSSSE